MPEQATFDFVEPKREPYVAPEPNLATVIVTLDSPLPSSFAVCNECRQLSEIADHVTHEQPIRCDDPCERCRSRHYHENH